MFSFPLLELASSSQFQTLIEQDGIGYLKLLRDQLFEEGQMKEQHGVPNSNAATFHIESADDIDHVVWLF